MIKHSRTQKRNELLLNMVGNKCPICKQGHLRASLVTHDLGRLLGMVQVKVENMPALKCDRCGKITVTGPVIDGVSMLLAAHILSNPRIGPYEVRFLRKLLGDTQDEFADKLSVDRVTVNRWENSDGDIEGITSEAIRLHSYLRLRGRSMVIDSIASALLSPKRGPARAKGETPIKRRGNAGYALDGASISAGIAA